MFEIVLYVIETEENKIFNSREALYLCDGKITRGVIS